MKETLPGEGIRETASWTESAVGREQDRERSGADHLRTYVRMVRQHTLRVLSGNRMR